MDICFASASCMPSFDLPKDGNTYLAVELPRCVAGPGTSLIIGKKTPGVPDQYEQAFLDAFAHYRLIRPKNWFIDSLSIYNQLLDITRLANVDILHVVSADPVILPILCRLGRRTGRLKLVLTVAMTYYGARRAVDVTIPRIWSYGKLFDGICCTSEAVREFVGNCGVEKGKVYYVPPPIDCDTFSPVKHRREVIDFDPASDEGQLVLFFGDLNPLRFPARKILSAMRILKERGTLVNLLCVVRYSTDPERIYALASKMGLSDSIKIEVTSSLRNDDKVALYNAADAVIFPFEGFIGIDPPVTLLEAMSCGSVVVASRMQGMPYVVEDGKSGVLIDRMTPEGIANALETALYSRLRERISHNARKVVQRDFSRDITFGRMLGMYGDLLGK